MKVVRKILYWGENKEFKESLSELANDYLEEDFKIDELKPSEGGFLDHILAEDYNIVFLDLEEDESIKQAFREMIFLKRIPRYRSVLFCGLFSLEGYESYAPLAYASGLQLSFKRGGELPSFILDSFYIGLGEKIIMPTFAKAREIDKTLEVGLCSSLSCISSENLELETDLEQQGSHICLNLELFSDFRGKSFDILKHESNTEEFPFLESFQLSYPYVGPWDEITEETLQKETVETWLDNNKELLVPKERLHFKLFSSRPETLKALYQLDREYDIKPLISNQFEESSFRSELSSRKPALIFMDLDKDEQISIGDVIEVIAVLKTIDDYNPIVIVSNSPSKAEALRKSCGYSNIVCTPRCNKETLELFIKSYLEKSSAANQELKEFRFKAETAARAIDVYFDIEITSLSEHEVSFQSSLDLPYFSVLHFSLPIEFYVTIVPSYEKSGKGGESGSYLGLIHGLAEPEAQLLRKFVNQIIYKPIEKFSLENVKKALEQKVERESAELTEDIDASKDVEAEKQSKCFEREALKGKSKL